MARNIDSLRIHTLETNLRELCIKYINALKNLRDYGVITEKEYQSNIKMKKEFLERVD